MLRRSTLGDGRHTLCANCAALAGRRKPTLAELAAERFGGGRPGEAQLRGLGAAAFLKEREALHTDSERRCECATCTSGGRPIHREPRFGS
jgi:hypothetical protein